MKDEVLPFATLVTTIRVQPTVEGTYLVDVTHRDHWTDVVRERHGFKCDDLGIVENVVDGELSWAEQQNSTESRQEAPKPPT